MNEIFGAYSLLKQLGQGGFGTVYMALRQSNNEVVALKVLNPELSQNGDFVARMRDEAITLRAISAHPHIVRLLDYGVVQGRPFLVMEYLGGEDLYDRLYKESRLPIKQALGIAAQAAEALDAAAARDLIHCDIKPKNIRLLPPGDFVKVMDFGISRAAWSSVQQAIGTPAYMPPEQWLREPPTQAIDTYALGCTLYEMLTGLSPYRATSTRPIDVERQHFTTDPDWSLLEDAVVPDELRRLLGRMLAKSAKDRPALADVGEGLQKIARLVRPDAVLSAAAGRITDETTRVHVESSTPAGGTPPEATSRWELQPVVAVTPAFNSPDLGAAACQAAMIDTARGALVTGGQDGRVCSLNLSSGRASFWPVFTPGTVRSLDWAFAAHQGRIILHSGGQEWVAIESESGQVIERGALPRPGLEFIATHNWLYMWGRRDRLYRSPWNELGRYEEFSAGSMLTGAPVITADGCYAPTLAGIVWLDTRTGAVTHFDDPNLTVKSLAAYGDRLVVVYSSAAPGSAARTVVRLFAAAKSSLRLLAEAGGDGQCAGPAVVTQDRIIVAGRTGRVRAWQVVQSAGQWALHDAWSCQVGDGWQVSSAPAFGRGLIAITSCRDNRGILSILNAGSGQALAHPLGGDVFVSPLWWEGTLSVIVASGRVDVYRTLLA